MNEKSIWDYLLKKLGNSYGTAALMGNLYVESKLNPKDLQGSYSRKFGMSDEEYTAAVDSGEYAGDTFIHDGAGYGLAQWTYWSRKEALYRFAKEHGKSIGDLQMQLDYLWDELQKYKTVLEALKNATDIRVASDVVVKRYEKPLNQTETLLQNRANYGKKFYDQFADVSPAKLEPEVKPIKKMVVATANVNVRNGNGKQYDKIGLLMKDLSCPWVATSENGWYAIEFYNEVLWVSSEFARIE